MTEAEAVRAEHCRQRHGSGGRHWNGNITWSGDRPQ
jgi:hypothetical protein